MKAQRGLGYLTALILLGGCATMAPPQQNIIASQAAIRAAEEVGANRVPAAALHLQLAKEQSDLAQKLIKEHDNRRAAYVLMRCEADAELSLALAREAPLRAQAQEASEKLQALQQNSISEQPTP